MTIAEMEKDLSPQERAARKAARKAATTIKRNAYHFQRQEKNLLARIGFSRVQLAKYQAYLEAGIVKCSRSRTMRQAREYVDLLAKHLSDYEHALAVLRGEAPPRTAATSAVNLSPNAEAKSAVGEWMKTARREGVVSLNTVLGPASWFGHEQGEMLQ